MATRAASRRGRRGTTQSTRYTQYHRSRRALSVSDTEDESDDSEDVPLISRRPSTRLSTTPKRARNLPIHDAPRTRPSRGGNTTSGSGTKRERAVSSSSRKKPKENNRRRTLGAARRPNTAPKPAASRMTYNWPPNLPYHVMLEILQYAACPLVDDQFIGTRSVNWLCHTALVCKAFVEPALSALYYSPPLLPASRAHGLLHLLEAPQDSHVLNYRSKIRFLDIEAVNVLTLKHAGQNPISLQKLVVLLPQVQGVRIHLHTDSPGTVELARKVAPVYTAGVFDEMDQSKVTLRQWKWNYQITTQNSMPWSHMLSLHSRPCFRLLKKLEVNHLGDPLKLNKTRWNTLLGELASSLSCLVSLESVMFTKCRLNAYEDLLVHVPKLKALTFVDCDELRSDYVSHLLRAHGSQLKELILKHNRYLNLGFTSTLAVECPSLVLFLVDFQCFSNSLITGNAEPLFEAVLPEGMKPTWPSALQRIDIAYIRKWELATAKDFFDSLLDANHILKDLRTLNIKASLECDWKERIKFRDTWIGKMEDAFLRRCPPPIRYGGMTNTNGNQKHFVKADRSTRSGAASGEQESTEGWETRSVQPLCEVVDVRIDNLRPMQNMFDEGDFMDGEPSDDGDFNPGRGETRTTRDAYAW